MTMGSRHAGEDREFGLEDAFSFFSETSLLIARAQSETELRRALDEAASWLARRAKAPVVIAELGLSANGAPRILWQTRTGGFSLDEDESFASWYARVTRQGQRLASHASQWHGLLSDPALSGDTRLSTGIFFQGKAPAPEVLLEARGLADIAALSSVRIRAAMAAALARRHAEKTAGKVQSWLDLEADVLWETDDEGIIRVGKVLNGRSDIASLVDGMKLASLRTPDGESLQEVLRVNGRVRRLRASVGNPAEGGMVLLVSATMNDAAACIGTFADDEESTTRLRHEAAMMMVQMRGARLREEQQRREAEAMLQGLRLLLAQDSTREKMDRLVSLVCECLGARDPRVVQRGLDGHVRFLMPRDGRPGRNAEAALDAIEGRAASVLAMDADEEEGSKLARAFGLEGGHFAVLPLPLRGDAAYLICTARRAEGFSPADLDFADRLTLLLRQALLLREEQGQLAQTAKMAALGQMSASIAHELRQPLNTISLAVQNLEILLQAPEVDEAAIATKTKRVLAQVERASEVIDRMRRFGRKSTGEQERVSLRDLVENVETIMHHVLLRAGVRLELDVPDDVAVRGDQLQFEQVLGNLVQNAVDAISGIGAKHERDEGLIRIRAERHPEEADMVVLRVEDSGPGFRQEILERVLEPFFTTKSAEHGTGLGLAICDTIIRESGGRIELGNHESGGYVALILPRDTA